MGEPDLDQLFAETPVLVAYLFGSQASGRARPQSDRDIAVLFAPGLDARERGRWRIELIGRLMDAYQSDAIDLIILNDAPPLLCFEVIRDRHVLYNRDDEQRVAFEVRTMREWFDWEPPYRRMQQARLRRFAERATPQGGEAL